MEILPAQNETGPQVMLDRQLNNRQSDELRQNIEQLARHHKQDIILNCSRLQSISAVGIEQINALLSRFSQLRLAQVSEPVAALLQLCGLFPEKLPSEKPDL
ncbi:STAS domain-containing protein [Thalassomonas viridans]|uniref:STAS domain-containing protein n=2 Tax=Thalassomonas viridans TaxID=137584 RepID=A0AAE9Z9R0_9GAMM|nr:STAS domain-containing protein [Thalassomonas viridans]